MSKHVFANNSTSFHSLDDDYVELFVFNENAQWLPFMHNNFLKNIICVYTCTCLSRLLYIISFISIGVLARLGVV